MFFTIRAATLKQQWPRVYPFPRENEVNKAISRQTWASTRDEVSLGGITVGMNFHAR
jgi:hypothetical protein